MFLVCMCAKSLLSCLTLCDPMDYNPPGSSIHGILQARMLEWAALLSSKGSSGPRDRTRISTSPALAGRFLTTNATWEAHVSGTCGHNFDSNFFLRLMWFFFKVASFLLVCKSQYCSEPFSVMLEPAVPSIKCTSYLKSVFKGIKMKLEINYNRNVYTIKISMHEKKRAFLNHETQFTSHEKHTRSQVNGKTCWFQLIGTGTGKKSVIYIYIYIYIHNYICMYT